MAQANIVPAAARRLPHLLETVGNTPLVSVALERAPGVEIALKVEYANPTGSAKDRAAAYVLPRLLEQGRISRGTWIVETSSGNMGVALGAYCRSYGLPFHCVIEPRTSPVNEGLIRELATSVFKVTQRDAVGGYHGTRLAAVREFVDAHPGAYWVNQYANPLVADAFYETLGAELCEALDRIDYAFVPVSSGGTITGLSRRVKEHFPACKVIAVDSEGSVIFGGKPGPRLVPGVGSSIVPEILASARIDEVVAVDHVSGVEACHRLLADHAIFAGGSSGFVIAAIERYFARAPVARGGDKPIVVGILPDRGDRYSSTIYDPSWCEKLRSGSLAADERRA